MEMLSSVAGRGGAWRDGAVAVVRQAGHPVLACSSCGDATKRPTATIHRATIYGNGRRMYIAGRSGVLAAPLFCAWRASHQAVVARILNPRDFGVFAVALTAYAIVSAIGELGVAACLVRADLDLDSLAPTMATISLTTSAALAFAMAAFARPITVHLGQRPLRARCG